MSNKTFIKNQKADHCSQDVYTDYKKKPSTKRTKVKHLKRVTKGK